jgi:hypothetical protein
VAQSCIRFNAGNRSKPGKKDAQYNTLKKNILVVSPRGKDYGGCTRFMTFSDNRVVSPHQRVRISDNGKRGKALLCDGIASFVEVRHDSKLEPIELTVEAWVRLDKYPSGKASRQWIVSKNANEWEAGHYGLVISGKKVGAYLNIGGGRENNFSAWSEDDVVKLNAWQHLAMTYDGKDLRVYADGTRVAGKPLNKKRTAGYGPFAIGKRPDGYSYFRGLVDEVRLYGRALSAAEIEQRAKGAADAAEPEDLVRGWTFDDASASNDDISALIEAAKAKAGPRPPWRERFQKKDKRTDTLDRIAHSGRRGRVGIGCRLLCGTDADQGDGNARAAYAVEECRGLGRSPCLVTWNSSRVFPSCLLPDSACAVHAEPGQAEGGRR